MTLAALAACSASPWLVSPSDAAHAAARRWVAALNASNVHAVGQLSCPDEGFRAAEMANARSGTDLGPYHFHYVLDAFEVLSPTRAKAEINQRLTTTLAGRSRVSDLPRSFAVVRRGGVWFVCPAGAR